MPGRTTLPDTPLLAGMTDEDRDAFVHACSRETRAAGESFFDAAENDMLYLLLEGHVRVTLEGTEGAVELTVVGPGQTFGEMSLITGRRGVATVVAQEDVTVLSIKRDDIEALLQARPQLAIVFWRNLCRHVAERLQATDQLVEHYADRLQVLRGDRTFRTMFGGT